MSTHVDADCAPLLDARKVLCGGYGRYWRFTISPANRGAPDPEAIYVRSADATGLKGLLAAHVRWFMPHGTSRVMPGEVAALVTSLSHLSRMPDEGERRELWQALAQWLGAQDGNPVFVRMQVFR